MGIGSITSGNRMQTMQSTASDLKDQKSKSLQNEIEDVQQQIQKLSSEEELSAAEKADAQKKLQKEKSNLTTELKQHQEQLQKSQKRELELTQLREDMQPSKEEAAKDDIRAAETSSNAVDAVRQDAPVDGRQALQPGTIITQSADGVVILKGFADQNAANGTTPETKQANGTTEAADKAETAAEKKAVFIEETEEDSSEDDNQSFREMQAMVSADSSMQQAERQGTLVNETAGNIAVLKSEIKQDALRGADTDQKEAELKEMQKQQKRELAAQFSMLGELNQMSAADTSLSATSTAQQNNAERTFHVSGVNASPEEQALQQGFQVSIA